jgi:LAO/AO transport system kinase
MNLTAPVLAGDRLALSRLLTQVENETAQGYAALEELFAHTGKAHIIGVTGAPGTGKSSLVNQLARYYRQSTDGRSPCRVAVIAVDPSSPFTGGAILGDRIRMKDLTGDPGVFVRSMASRGLLGGLARTTASMAQIFDAAGYEVILIETVGAGQAEVEIARLAHTTLVVEAPGMGDDIQAIKAGILEIADILVINKADQPGVENSERALRSMLDLSHPVPHVFKQPASGKTIQADELRPHPGLPEPLPFWATPIQRTIATQDTGTAELAAAIHAHLTYLKQSGEWVYRDRARLQAMLDSLLQEALIARWRETITESHYSDILNSLLARRITPFEALSSMLVDVNARTT